MLIVTLLTALSALFIVSAAPLPVYHRVTVANLHSRNILYRRTAPKFEIPIGFMDSSDPSQKQDTLDKLLEHHETKSTDEQKGARLVSAVSRWNTLSLASGRQYMKFNYHAGDTTDSPIIGPTAEIYRDKPVPKIVFGRNLKDTDHREEMTVEAMKRWNGLGLVGSSRVKSMKVWGKWHPNDGIRDKAEITFHSAIRPNVVNVMGKPTTIHRPLTLQLPDVPSYDKKVIYKNVRAAHKTMVADRQHPAKTSNYGTINSGWHDSFPDENGNTHLQVVVGLEKVSEDEKERKHLGYYAVRKGTSDHEQLNSRPSFGFGSHAEPSRLINEVPRPSSSQDSQKQQHLNIASSSTYALSPNSGSSQVNAGSPSTYALPSGPGSSHLISQGSSQFGAGGRPSQPRISHPELLHPVSPHQPLQFDTNSPPWPGHNEFHIPSPELRQPWDPASEPSHETWQSLHPDLYSDQLWRAESPSPRSSSSNSQIQPHPSTPPSQFNAGHPSSPPGPSLPGSPHLNSQGPSQFGGGSPSQSGPSHSELLHPVSPHHSVQSHIDSPPQRNEFYMPSPELWRSWDPASQSSHETWQSLYPDLYSDQLWHVGSPPPKSPASNTKVLPHTSSPTSLSGLSHPKPGQPSNAVPPSNPGGSPHTELSPEIWQLLHPDSAYPYSWYRHQYSP